MNRLAYTAILLSSTLFIGCSDHAHHDHAHHTHGEHDSHEHWHEHSHAHEHQHGSHTHTHGRGELEVVLEDRFLLVRAELPASDILGFEHSPRTDDERAHFAEHEQRLSMGQWIMPPSAARCTFLDARVSFDGNQDHGDLVASLRYECERLNEINALRVNLFEQYPSLSRIAVVWLSEQAQGVTELSHAQPLINILAHP